MPGAEADHLAAANSRPGPAQPHRGQFPQEGGASGSSSSRGRNARSWRAAAMEIHSPVSGSCRSSGTGGRGAGGRVSAARSGPRTVSASSK
ncbi:MAG TPA: hypothetical protein VKG80_11025 [Trebonia sp.]|nr:hypothetical protein [Trebonia sp.]